MSSWVRPHMAGGCLNHPDTFLNNPQYRFDIEGKEGSTEEVILQLSQRDEGTQKLIRDKLKLVIGLHLIQVETNRQYRLHTKIAGSDRGSSDYIRSRHVFFRTSLTPGRYLVLPTTFNPGEEADFLLRLFSDKSSGLEPLTLDQPPEPSCLACGCGSRPQIVTRVTVVSASGLEKQDMIGQADPYAFIKCEGEKLRSQIVKNSLEATWNFSAIFYRKRPEKPIKIQIWNSNLMVDQFMGQTVVDSKDQGDVDNPFGEEATRQVRVLDLYGRKSQRETKMAGQIKVKIETFKDLAAL